MISEILDQNICYKVGTCVRIPINNQLCAAVDPFLYRDIFNDIYFSYVSVCDSVRNSINTNLNKYDFKK